MNQWSWKVLPFLRSQLWCFWGCRCFLDWFRHGFLTISVGLFGWHSKHFFSSPRWFGLQLVEMRMQTLRGIKACGCHGAFSLILAHKPVGLAQWTLRVTHKWLRGLWLLLQWNGKRASCIQFNWTCSDGTKIHLGISPCDHFQRFHPASWGPYRCQCWCSGQSQGNMHCDWRFERHRSHPFR